MNTTDASSPDKIFLLYNWDWDQPDATTWGGHPARHPLAVFDTNEEVRRYLQQWRRDVGMIPTFNPFDPAFWHRQSISEDGCFLHEVEVERVEDLTSFPVPIFQDWLLEAGLELPRPQRPTEPNPLNRWAQWYEEGRSKWTSSQLRQVWKALDKVKPFHVVEVEVGD